MIEFHYLAVDELRQALAWYRAKSVRAAERFVERVHEAVLRVLADPESYPVIRRGFHYLRIPKFPFVLVYRIRAQNDVFVIAVAHTSRRSGYWRRRKS